MFELGLAAFATGPGSGPTPGMAGAWSVGVVGARSRAKQRVGPETRYSPWRHRCRAPRLQPSPRLARRLVRLNVKCLAMGFPPLG